jgi:hypothetical protein
MFDVNEDGIWEVTVNLPEGNIYYYYSTDQSYETIDDRVLNVSESTTLAPVYWNSDDGSNGNTTYDVTFQVDMNYVDPTVFNEVSIWYGNQLHDYNNFAFADMFDVNEDGIWEVTLNLPEGNIYYYYSTDQSYETIDDRVLNVSESTTLAPVYWNNENTSVDTTLPVITLNGAASVTIPFGSTYTDAGATATDNVDGNITSSIVTVNPVDTSIAGTYTITYNVSDSSGNAANQVTRTVTVEEEVVVDTVEEITLKLGWNLIGSSFNCTILDENSIIVPNTMYEFNNTYTNTFTPVTTLEANEGYWIKASSAGTIKLIKQE